MKLAINGGKPIRKNRIPFHRPLFDEGEIKAAIQVIKSGQVAGGGQQSQAFEKELQKYCQVKHVLLTTSCTSALELALLVLGIKPGDEVICPSFSFVSVANAIVLRGAQPVFVDIEPVYYNLDPQALEKAISKKTKAIICVHYAGLACQMKEILALAKKYHLVVIEDAAHALGAKYHGQHLGTIGQIGCFSFHQTKNITTGEGGAFLTNNKNYARLAEIMIEKGTNRRPFLRGEIDKYTWINIGSSYVLSDILAAIGRQQLKKTNHIIRKRRQNAHYLTQGLKKYRHLITLPKLPADIQTNWHIYAIRAPKTKRDWLLRALKAEGVEATFHFLPLHLSPYAKKNLKYKKGDLPVTEEVCDTLIRLPIYPQLSKKDLDDIIKAFDKLIPYLF